MDFAASVRANCDKKLLEINTKCYAIVFKLFTSIVYRTPVKTGLLKNSWYTMADKTFSTTVGSTPNSQGMDSLARISSLKQSESFLGKDGVVTMANNQDYAYKAEMTGWARTPPYRMVALSFIDLRNG